LELLSVLDVFVSIFTCGVVLDKQPTLENLVLLLAVIIVPVGGCPSHSPLKAIHHFFVTMQKQNGTKSRNPPWHLHEARGMEAPNKQEKLTQTANTQ
jgi:hypothetical protein